MALVPVWGSPVKDGKVSIEVSSGIKKEFTFKSPLTFVNVVVVSEFGISLTTVFPSVSVYVNCVLTAPSAGFPQYKYRVEVEGSK